MAASKALDRHLIKATSRLSPDGYADSARSTDYGCRCWSAKRHFMIDGRCSNGSYRSLVAPGRTIAYRPVLPAPRRCMLSFQTSGVRLNAALLTPAWE